MRHRRRAAPETFGSIFFFPMFAKKGQSHWLRTTAYCAARPTIMIATIASLVRPAIIEPRECANKEPKNRQHKKSSSRNEPLQLNLKTLAIISISFDDL